MVEDSEQVQLGKKVHCVEEGSVRMEISTTFSPLWNKWEVYRGCTTNGGVDSYNFRCVRTRILGP